ncbi:MAG: hypothetical protein IPM54_08685 [Polyangiaceae bacterium]|nr:hypothetical protein [Polyangiaceae bacterium]
MIFKPYDDFETGCPAYLVGYSSTIASERRWNPLLSMSREEFIEAVSDVPPKPAAMEQILRINQGRKETRQ